MSEWHVWHAVQRFVHSTMLTQSGSLAMQVGLNNNRPGRWAVLSEGKLQLALHRLALVSFASLTVWLWLCFCRLTLRWWHLLPRHSFSQ